MISTIARNTMLRETTLSFLRHKAKSTRKYLAEASSQKTDQEKLFKNIHANMKKSYLANKYKMQKMKSYTHYVREMPRTQYADYKPMIEALDNAHKSSIPLANEELCSFPIKQFVVTSGTTGYQNKLIPITDEMTRAIRKYQTLVATSIALECENVNPLFDDRLVYAAGGPRPGNRDGWGNFQRTYVSTLVRQESPRLFQGHVWPKSDILKIDDWNLKSEKIIENCFPQDIRIAAAIPIFLYNLLVTAEQINGGKNLKNVWPNFEAVIYSGSRIQMYQSEIERILGRSLKYFSGYMASEGAFGWPINAQGEMCFLSDSYLFSFLPLNSTEDQFLGIHELQAGECYEVLVGLPNGFVQYAVGDVIRVQHTKPFLSFTVEGRKQATINLGNEKVSSHDLEQTLLRVTEQLKYEFPDFKISSEHFFVNPSQIQSQNESQDKKPGYHWQLFVEDAPNTINKNTTIEALLSEKIESTLSKINRNYCDSRKEDGLIGKTQVTLHSHTKLKNFFAKKHTQGQFKPKIVLPSQKEFEDYFLDQQ
jgi:GH3 auxin-responsive promoter